MRIILAICSHWGGPEEGSATSAQSRHERLAGGVLERLAAVGGEVAAEDGELIIALLASPEQALLEALDLLAGPCSGGALGLAAGEVAVSSHGVHGLEVSRARRLAWRAPPGQVTCTRAFREALAPVPSGIGLHGVAHDQAHRFGFEAFTAVDYRG